MHSWTESGLVLCLALVLVPAVATAGSATKGEPAEAAPSVADIVARANHVAYYQGRDGRAKIRMTISDAQGRTRSREFVILRKDAEGAGEQAKDGEQGAQKFYVYFRRPPDVNKMAYLVWKHIGADDDRWFYLPALDLVKRVAASDERTSFVGSDFFYEDVSGRGVEEDEHELVETTETYYKIRNTPKNPKAVEFDHYVAWIHRKTFIPVQIEYFDAQGAKYRVYQALKVETIQGRPTVTRAKMSDLRTKGFTINEYLEVKYDLGLPDSIFTERYLRRPPRKYLR